VALALAAPVILVTGASSSRDPGSGAIAAILSIAGFASLVAFLIRSCGANETGAARARQFVYPMPVFALLLAIAISGRVVTAAQSAGAICVSAGSVLASLAPRAPARAPRHVPPDRNP